MRFPTVLPILLLVACHADAPMSDSPLGKADDPSQNDGCPTDELDFEQATGCQNDGFVEFCLPRGDDASLDAVLELSPDASCYPDRPSAGRIGCDLEVEYLCLHPIAMTECEQPYGALDDDGWRTVCELADLEAIDRIAPTWFL